MKDLNQEYFDLLVSEFNNPDSDNQSVVLHEPERGIDSNIICIPIATKKDLESITI